MIVKKPKAEKLLGKKLKGRKTQYYVLSAAGDRNLGGPYTLSAAKDRLRQVEFFKRNPRKELYIKPNQAAVRAAKKGLEARKKAPKSKKGGLTALEASEEGIGSGVMRARDIAAGKKINAYQVKAFFDRHRHNYLKAKAKGLKPEESKALQAWLLWGGEPLRKQVEKAVAKDKKENPSKPFWDRDHDWDEILIQQGQKILTRKDILDYYLKTQKKIWPFLKNQTVMVYIGTKKNKTVLRRIGPNGKYIKLIKLKGIEDPNSFEYWIYRRVIEFHVVLTDEKTPLIWCELDMHKTKSEDARKVLYLKMKNSVSKIKKILKSLGATKVYVYDSGTGGGIHLEGPLARKKDVDKLRDDLRESLKEAFKDNPIFTTGIAKSGMIRLDVTTLHELGSLRAPYSMTKTGGIKKRIKA